MPPWFIVPLEATVVFDTPGRVGGAPIVIERSCFRCQNDWPYPELGEIEDAYVERLRARKRDPEAAPSEPPKTVYRG